MKIQSFFYALFSFFSLFVGANSMAQVNLSGKVVEEGTQTALAGVSIRVKDKVVGTITDGKGDFSLSVSTSPPFTLIFSSVGYQSQEMDVTEGRSNIVVSLKEEIIMGREVIVSASRVEESVLQSPVSIERLDIRSIRESPAPTFFDAIRNLKGVDMSTQSMTFSNPNTRGFSGNGNLRMVQLVDGMDNQAPGLNFSVANIAGLSELDVESVELLPGAASALYGANAVNGILLMNSKSPFLYQGLSAYVKTGVMHADNRVKRYSHAPEATTPFYDVGIRYARAFDNKLAFKVNFTYLKAKDWQATDYRDQSLSNGYGFNGTEEWNPGYDGINVYGDPSVGISSFLGQNMGAIAQMVPALQPLHAGVQQLGGLFAASPQFPDITTPAQGYQRVFQDVYGNATFARRGYKERDLVDYNAYSIKTNASLHYRLNDRVEALLQANWGLGTTVYTGADRYFIKNFTIGQYKAEIKGANFFVRGYTTQENSGDTYAVGLAGLGVNRMWTIQNGAVATDPTYFATYGATLAGATLAPILQSTMATLASTGNVEAAYMNYLEQITQYKSNENAIAQQLRGQVGSGRSEEPGSKEFVDRLNKVTAIPIPGDASNVGAKFLERTALYHLETMYNFNQLIDPKTIEIIAGASYRLFDLNSKGTLFYQDENGKEPNITEIGGYIQAQKTIANLVKLTGSVRYDKNNNFKGQFSPRLSGVLTLDKNHNLRASFQTAFRIPDAQAQFIDLLTPQARLIGGLPQLREKYFSGANVMNIKTGQPFTFTEFKPERVISTEVGYKGLIANALFADVYYYNSVYKNFIVGNNLLATTGDFGGQVFGMQSNYEHDIKTHGFGIGLDYALPASFTLGGNLSNNTLRAGGVKMFSSEMNKAVLDDGSDIGFNTPKFRYSLNLGNRNIARTGWAFSLIWRHQDKFIWNSSFVPNAVKFATDITKQALIPAIGTLDAQVSKKLSGVKSIVKIGGTNILNKQYVTGWGNPTVGSMYYVSLTFDQLLN
jgi:iron complex outermembrane receptor protein